MQKALCISSSILFLFTLVGAQGTESALPDLLLIPAKFETSIDYTKAKTGDEIELRVLENVKSSDGKVLIPANARLLGSISYVSPASASEKHARLSLGVHKADWRSGRANVNAFPVGLVLKTTYGAAPPEMPHSAPTGLPASLAPPRMPRSSAGNFIYKDTQVLATSDRELGRGFELVFAANNTLIPAGTRVQLAHVASRFNVDHITPHQIAEVDALDTLAGKGDADAQFKLGFLYAQGQILNLDWAKAAAWYERAAEQKDARAMTNLGLLYAQGQGVAQDYVQAYVWLKVSGLASNQQGLDLLEKSMNGNQIVLAKEKAEAWTKAHL